ncbi:YceI family protein [Lutibacter holmesii]|uniref:YceI family protein n=1 Tax=Lutibacter holmesii TaxID=1137985 RepID=A0ABW3WQW5_9FLAO
MKKLLFLSLFFVLTLTIVSCGNDKKEKKASEKNTSEKTYSIEPKTTTINWTAYKTTDKVPVKGQFTKFTIENTKNGTTAIDALNGLKFSIPVSSIFTKDTIRDGKLKKFFFDKMLDTQEIKGTLHFLNETSGTADITMNGVSQELPITYVIDGQMVSIEGIMNLDNWKAQIALESLNAACLDLHKGADGISKTWSDVKIEVVTYLKQN